MENRYIEQTQPWVNDLKPGLIFATHADIRHHLSHYGIDFEGSELPVSLTPTIIHEQDLTSIVRPLQLIREQLNKVIDGFISEHLNHELDGPLHHFFSPYRKWWDLIASDLSRILLK